MAFAQKLTMLSFFALLSLSEQKPTAPLRNLVRSCSNYKQANLRFHYKHFGEILSSGLFRYARNDERIGCPYEIP
ncbi:MAG: hypothetical protein K2N75_02860 [Helicobacter sp.]|uniref:hypothetical protein n=1 Tax=Helicobacter sp. TaxID=218 RepID=UPI0023C05F41|nr:hypothetical protein [Helicobacter sp.]MDE7174981.1 hypothetical protein [Helicobacter sp.]